MALDGLLYTIAFTLMFIVQLLCFEYSQFNASPARSATPTLFFEGVLPIDL
jgi:hypothetical protein